MNLDDGFDAELRSKLRSGRYNIAKVIRDTKVSRYIINHIKSNIYVQPFYIVALNEYFKKVDAQ
jgi:hypothetical protein